MLQQVIHAVAVKRDRKVSVGMGSDGWGIQSCLLECHITIYPLYLCTKVPCFSQCGATIQILKKEIPEKILSFMCKSCHFVFPPLGKHWDGSARVSVWGNFCDIIMWFTRKTPVDTHIPKSNINEYNCNRCGTCGYQVDLTSNQFCDQLYYRAQYLLALYRPIYNIRFQKPLQSKALRVKIHPQRCGRPETVDRQRQRCDSGHGGITDGCGELGQPAGTV